MVTVAILFTTETHHTSDSYFSELSSMCPQEISLTEFKIPSLEMTSLRVHFFLGGPLYFNMYINDLLLFMKSSTCGIFADNTAFKTLIASLTV